MEGLHCLKTLQGYQIIIYLEDVLSLFLLAFTPFSLIPEVLNKVTEGNTDLVLMAPIWQAQPCWLIMSSLLVSNPVLLPHSPHLFEIPQIQAGYRYILSPFWPCVTLPAVLPNRGLTRSSSHKAYQMAWSCWSGWCTCAEGKIIPVSAHTQNFLIGLFQHCSINVLHSAISSTQSVGQYPYVEKFIRGKRTELPLNWNLVTHILGMSRKWQHTSLPWKITALCPSSSCWQRKLVMLFTLVCPERTASLAKLNLRYCRIIPEGVVFSLASTRTCGNPNQLAGAFLASFPYKSESVSCWDSASLQCTQRNHEQFVPLHPAPNETLYLSLMLSITDPCSLLLCPEKKNVAIKKCVPKGYTGLMDNVSSAVQKDYHVPREARFWQ